MTPCGHVLGYQGEDGGSMNLWNPGILSFHYTASLPTRTGLEAVR